MGKEPLWIIIGGGTTLVQAVLALLIAFGVPLSAEQNTAITTVVGLLLTAYARTHVVPVASLPPGVAAKIADNNAKG